MLTDWRSFFPALLVASLLVEGACGSAAPGGTAEQGVSVTLAPVAAGSGSGGVARLDFHQDMSFLEVALTVHGLAALSAHAVDIDRGSCVAPGPVLYAIPDVRVRADGSGDVTDTVVGVEAAPPPGAWSMWVRGGPSERIAATARQSLLPALLCGDVP